MNSRFLAQHFTVNISKFQLPRKGVKSQLSRSSCMYMYAPKMGFFVNQIFSRYFDLDNLDPKSAHQALIGGSQGI